MKNEPHDTYEYPFLAVRDGRGMKFTRFTDAADYARKVEGFVIDRGNGNLLAMYPEDDRKEPTP